MTIKTLRYEILVCDICKCKTKKEIIENRSINSWNAYTLRSVSMPISADFTIEPTTVRPDPIKLDMCPECEQSFNHWKDRRERGYHATCDCGCEPA